VGEGVSGRIVGCRGYGGGSGGWAVVCSSWRVGGMGGLCLLEAFLIKAVRLAVLAARQSSALKTRAQVLLIQWVVELLCFVSRVYFSRLGMGVCNWIGGSGVGMFVVVIIGIIRKSLLSLSALAFDCTLRGSSGRAICVPDGG